MKKAIFGLLIALCIQTSFTTPAKQFGVGFRFGSPTGFDAKLWLNQINSLNFALGWGSSYYGNGRDGYFDNRCYDGGFFDQNKSYCRGQRFDYYDRYNGYDYGFFHIHGDYLWHNFNVIRAAIPIPLYYGIGIQYEHLRHYDPLFGMRGTFGIDFIPTKIPFDFFVEITPAFIFLPGPDFNMYGGIGARFWF